MIRLPMPVQRASCGGHIAIHGAHRTGLVRRAGTWSSLPWASMHARVRAVGRRVRHNTGPQA